MIAKHLLGFMAGGAYDHNKHFTELGCLADNSIWAILNLRQLGPVGWQLGPVNESNR